MGNWGTSEQGLLPASSPPLGVPGAFTPPGAASQGQWGASLYHLISRLPPQVPAVLISATGTGATLSSLPRAGAVVGRVGTEAVAGLGSQQPVPFLLSTLARPHFPCLHSKPQCLGFFCANKPPKNPFGPGHPGCIT